MVDSGELDRPTVLLIHGYPTSSWDWAPIWDRLGQTHRRVAMDLLGFGFSDKPNPYTYRIMEQADLCEAVVRHAGLSEFDVLVHDYGVTVGQELLARVNEGTAEGRWRSVCFLNGGLFPETHRARLIQRLLLSPLGPLITRLSSKRTFDRSFSAVFGPDTQPSTADLEAFWAIINERGGKHALHNLIRYIPDRIEHRERWVAALREAQVPIALINGSRDPVSGEHMIEHYRRIIRRDDTIVQLPNIGHYPQVEAPQAVAAAWGDFVRIDAP